jgi:hypothetical protein
MSARAAAWLAWSLLVLCVALVALAGLLSYLAPPVPRWELTAALGVLFAVPSLTYPAVGALIASRRPRSPIGWIFCATGLVLGIQSVAQSYADYSVFAQSSSLPGTRYVAWLADTDITSLAMVPLLAWLLLLFPDGRPPSRSWSIAGWAAVIGSALLALSVATWPGHAYYYPSINNPFGIEGSTRYVVEVLGRIGALAVMVSLVTSGLSWVSRWQEAQREERQQLKWFGYSLVLILAAFLIDPWLLLPPALALLPIAAGIAILRYHLYNIDVVINRTLVYGSLTAMLAAVYFGGVTATQAIFRTITGHEQQSQLAIVVSTLVIAALFNPLRRRIQAFIDRRFYRRKYDAKKTLEAFSAKLRDETDLDALSEDLVGVVRETMQPAHVSLWLRPDPVSKKGAQDD